MLFVIEGMRNPKNSWRLSDTLVDDNVLNIGEKDHNLMKGLSDAGDEHRKYLRMMPVMIRITAPLYWWKEFDTYKIGTVSNSCSTMHKIAAKEFDRSDFSHEHIPLGTDAWEDPLMLFCINEEDNINLCSEDILDLTIQALNHYRKVYLETEDEKYWWQMIQLLPTSYNQTRNIFLNYEVLLRIHKQRHNHKLPEWHELCRWIESLPYSELITKEINMIRKDFYNKLPGFVCGMLDSLEKAYSKEDWFDAAWFEYRQHVLASTNESMKMPGFIFDKYVRKIK